MSDLLQGEFVLIKGKKRKDTLCVAVPDKTLDASHIRLTKVRRPCDSNIIRGVGPLYAPSITSPI